MFEKKVYPFHLSMKDLQTKILMLCCNSSGEPYPIPLALPCAFIMPSIDNTLWHHRLGHVGTSILQHLTTTNTISCNRSATPTCHACKLGKHTKLLF